MAFIEEFTIEGLAGHGEIVHRTLDRHVNIFWGLNGTGKTSLLKILTSALSNQVEPLKRVPFARAEVIFWSTAHNVKIRRRIESDLIAFDDDEDDFSQPSEVRLEPMGNGTWREIPQTGPSVVRSWNSEILEGTFPVARKNQSSRPATRRADVNAPFLHSYLPISRLSQVTYRGPRAGRPLIDDSSLDEDFAEQVRARWQTYNSESLAKIGAIRQQGLATILALLFGGGTGAARVQSERVNEDDAFALVAGFLAEQGIRLRLGQPEFERRYNEAEDLRDVVASIQDVTSEVEDALRPQREFLQVIENLYSGGKSLKLDSAGLTRRGLRVEIEGNRIPLQALSSGEKQLLRLMLEVLAAEEATVMIDEPELSMHVDWQQQLVAAMRKVNPKCQLLLATHSPEVMADVSDEVVFEL